MTRLMMASRLLAETPQGVAGSREGGERMDKKALRQAMAAKGINTYADLSRETGIPYSTLLYKSTMDTWTKDDIKTISQVLELTPEQTVFIFCLS